MVVSKEAILYTDSMAQGEIKSQEIDASLEAFTKLMDDQFEVYGFKFGINFIIDLIPGIGDIISTLIASYVFFKAWKYGISWFTWLRMLLNIVVFFIASLIPIIGDLFAAWWKPNRRNLRLLHKSVRR